MELLISHAVGQFGRDRTYTLRFGGSSPIVSVFEGDTLLAELWMANDVIQEKKFY